MIDKGVSSAVNTAIERAVLPIIPPWTVPTGPVLAVTFAASGERLIPHRLRGRPDGFLILSSTGAVYETRKGEWSDTHAYLTAPAANTVAQVLFFRLRSAPEGV